MLGYRGSHKIPDTTVDFIYQLEVQPQITHAPGVSTGYTSQSDVTKGGIGYGDSFIGVSNDKWGKLKAGTTYTPYKKSTDRMNPFSGMLGDYGAFMGNTGGDNRVEFGSRIDHSIWYESPKFGGLFSFDVLFSPGQNRTPYNEGQSSGSPDCAGGNVPGSGNLPLACADGAYDNAWSFDIKFEHGPIYFTAAYEIHQGVNRSSDGIGSNSPYYNSLFAINNIVDPVSGAVLSSTCSTTSPIIDCGSYNAYSAEYAQAATFGTPGYINDIANETAFKIGLQYKFDFGLAVSGIYEAMRRKLESDLNSRTSGRETASGLRPARISRGRITSASAGRTQALPWAIRAASTTTIPHPGQLREYVYRCLETPLRQEPILVFRRGGNGQSRQCPL